MYAYIFESYSQYNEGASPVCIIAARNESEARDELKNHVYDSSSYTLEQTMILDDSHITPKGTAYLVYKS